MPFLTILILGAIAGFLATRMMNMRLDIFTSTLLGVAGVGTVFIILRYAGGLFAYMLQIGFFIAIAVLVCAAILWLVKKR